MASRWQSAAVEGSRSQRWRPRARQLLCAGLLLLGFSNLLVCLTPNLHAPSSSLRVSEVDGVARRLVHRRRLISKTPRNNSSVSGGTGNGTPGLVAPADAVDPPPQASLTPPAGMTDKTGTDEAALEESDHSELEALFDRMKRASTRTPDPLLVAAVESPYLVTVFGMDDKDEPARMRHFLRYYLDTLGLRPDRCLFALHSNYGDMDGIETGQSALPGSSGGRRGGERHCCRC